MKNALVFSRTKHGANKIARDLVKAGIPAAAIHGNKSQTARVAGAGGFKAGPDQVLVATDIAARGSTSRSCPMSSTTTCPKSRKPTSTASAAPAERAQTARL